MSDAADKLARSRQAIIEQIARRERRYDPNEEPAGAGSVTRELPGAVPLPGEGWLSHLMRAVRTWWQYHPAHMLVELGTPALEAYARRKPVQLLGISALAGAALMLARPWRLISLTTIAVALIKSSQLSGILMSSLSAANYRRDHERPE